MKKIINFLIISATVLTLLASYSIFRFNSKNAIESDISLVREYCYDLFSLSRVDINNYSVNTNFQENYSDKKSEYIWKESMTFDYIQNADNYFKFERSQILTEQINEFIHQIHLKQIEFLKSNLIPMQDLEGENSSDKLDDYLDTLNTNKENLNKEIVELQDEITLNITDYINRMSKFGINLSLEEERKNYELYFEQEYENLSSKQLNLKMEELIN